MAPGGRLATVYSVAFILSVMPSSCICALESGIEMKSETHFFRAAQGISRGLSSLLSNSRYVNTDVLVSLAFSRGLLLSTNSSNEPSLDGALSALNSDLERANRKLRSELSMSGPLEQRAYLEDYEPLTHANAWPFDYDTAEIIETLREDPRPTRNLMGPIGNCVVRVMKGASFLCFLPDECYEILIESPTSGYTLTHQLFLALIWNHGPCEEKLGTFLATKGDSLNEFLARLCGSIFREAVALAAGGVDACNQDLFIEQLAFCQAVGMNNFFRPQWFDDIVSWQSSDGCFSCEARQAAECGFGVDSNSTVRYQHYRRRVKRDEVSIRQGDDICLLHKTSVALIYFSTIIKFVLS